MRITLFPSDKGDCLLLEGTRPARRRGGDARERGPTRMLVDGGMRASFVKHVAPALSELRGAGGRLDVVYVSHIDEDHIAGVLKLLDDLVAWRIFDHQRAGDADYPEPEVPRPPEVGEIWHNGFREQVRDNEGRIEQLLAATAVVLSGHPREPLREQALRSQNLVSGERQAILLQRRIGDRQLRIPLNRPAEGRLMMVREPAEAFEMGTFQVSILAPFEQDLDDLRRRWNKWLRDNRDVLERIRRSSERDEGLLTAGEAERFIGGMVAEAKALGNRKQVTVPNLASLMLLVEEDGKTVLLTGDGHADEVLAGLQHHGRLDADGRLHVDVLKIQHHGANANMTEDFARRITADHYVFCGNGEHENPELDVVEVILDSRLARGPRRTTNPAASGAFTLWFNCGPGFPDLATRNVEHMRKVERLVASRRRGTRSRVRAQFLEKEPLVLKL